MPKWKIILLFIATMASANLLGGRGPSSYRGRASVSFYTGLSRTRSRWPRSKSAWPPAMKSSWRSSTTKKTVSCQFIQLTANTQGKDLELGSFLSNLGDVNTCHMLLETENCIVSKQIHMFVKMDFFFLPILLRLIVCCLMNQLNLHVKGINHFVLSCSFWNKK